MDDYEESYEWRWWEFVLLLALMAPFVAWAWIRERWEAFRD